MKNDKKIIDVVIETISPYDFNNTLGNLQAHINDLVHQYGVDARMEWDGDYWAPYCDSPSPRYEVKAMREETDAEFDKRILDEKTSKSMQEERERKEFERLQAKFGAK